MKKLTNREKKTKKRKKRCERLSRWGVVQYLETDVPALVPDSPQQGWLSVTQLKQVGPHPVKHVQQVVGVCPCVLEHLLRQRSGQKHQ